MSKEVNLAPLRIKPSQQLWFAQLLLGLLLISTSLFATYHLIIQSTQWVLIELVFIAANIVWLVQCYKLSQQSTFELQVFSSEISIKKIIPEANRDQPAIPVKIKGEVLVWPWVIIIYFQSIKGDKKSFRFTVLQDSCSQEAWRQLRVYLLSRG